MLSKECRLARREIDEQELGERLSESLTAHLSTCVGCTEFRTERTALREMIGSLEPVTAPADFEMRLRARIARADSAARQESFFARLLRTPALAAAALFVVVGGTVVWVAQRDDDQPTLPIVTHQQPSQLTTTVATVTPNETAPGASPAVDEPPKPDPDSLAANPIGRRYRPRARTEDYSVGAAETVSQSDQAFVNAPSKPVVFSLEDESGTKRKIALPPVSFGARSLVDNRVPVSYSPNSRVW